MQLVQSQRYDEEKFLGDMNGSLERIQVRTRISLLSCLYRSARAHYIEAAQFIRVDTPLYKRLREMSKEYVELSPLQSTYEYFASYYRYAHDHGGQMELPFNKGTREENLENRWVQWFKREVDSVTLDGAITCGILSAVAFPYDVNTNGLSSFICTMLKDRYDDAICQIPPPWRN